MKRNNKMKKMKNQNLIAKIMSIVIAILLWSYVMTIENPDERRVIRNIRVKFLNAETLRDSDNQLMTPDEQFVNVTLRGKKNELERVSPDMISATIDLQGYEAGSKRIPIDVNPEGLSSLVNIEGVSPSSILVNIDKVVSRDFEVVVDTKGNPEENYMKGDYQLSSPKVQVTGAASQIGIIDSIKTSIDIDGKNKGFTVTNPLYAVGANGERLTNVTMKPDVVTISVPIYKTVVVAIEPSTFGNLPIDFETTKMSVNPPTISLKLIDENAVVPKTIKTEPINMEELVNSDEKVLKLIIPEGIEPIDNSQVYTLNYQIQKFTTKSFAVSKNQITFENIPQDLQLNEAMLPTIVDIVTRGYEKELKTKSAAQINLTVDLENAVEGENVLNLKLNPSDKSSLTLVGTPQIRVHLTRVEMQGDDNNDNDNNDNNDKNDHNDEKSDKTDGKK